MYSLSQLPRLASQIISTDKHTNVMINNVVSSLLYMRFAIPVKIAAASKIIIQSSNQNSTVDFTISTTLRKHATIH